MGEATAGVIYGPENKLGPLGINRPILLEKVKKWEEPLLLNEKQFIHLGNVECGALRLHTAPHCTTPCAPCAPRAPRHALRHAPRRAPRRTPRRAPRQCPDLRHRPRQARWARRHGA